MKEKEKNGWVLAQLGAATVAIGIFLHIVIVVVGSIVADAIEDAPKRNEPQIQIIKNN